MTLHPLLHADSEMWKTNKFQINTKRQRFSEQNSICLVTGMSFALVFMTCVCTLYRGKYDLFVTVFY